MSCPSLQTLAFRAIAANFEESGAEQHLENDMLFGNVKEQVEKARYLDDKTNEKPVFTVDEIAFFIEKLNASDLDREYLFDKDVTAILCAIRFDTEAIQTSYNSEVRMHTYAEGNVSICEVYTLTRNPFDVGTVCAYYVYNNLCTEARVFSDYVSDTKLPPWFQRFLNFSNGVDPSRHVTIHEAALAAADPENYAPDGMEPLDSLV
ncbi:MAG: hypothetical protein CMP20_15475 [Rickettsiales bacterium]|nr:hypothetical protein [Rickettsiales bacterium]